MKNSRQRQRGYWAAGPGAFWAYVVILIAIGFGLAHLVPWLWSIIKPLIHSATA